MHMKPPTVPLNYVNMPSQDDLVRTLRLIQHATAPMPDDGGYHEAAHDLASAVLSRVDAAALREGSNPKGECPPGPSAEHEEPGRLADAPNPEDLATMAAPTPQEPKP